MTTGMTNMYLVSVKNTDTGDVQDALWNVQAPDEATALANSDRSLRALGWAAGWVSYRAAFVTEVVNTARTIPTIR